MVGIVDIMSAPLLVGERGDVISGTIERKADGGVSPPLGWSDYSGRRKDGRFGKLNGRHESNVNQLRRSSIVL